MKIEPYRRLKPDVDSEWGTWASPYVYFEPENYKYRQPAVPWQAQNRHEYRMQPRNVSPISGILDNPDLMKWVLIIGGLSLVAYLIYSAGKGGSKRRRYRKPGMKKTSKQKLRRLAGRRKRDRKGRFV